jgi:hypothetical protein
MLRSYVLGSGTLTYPFMVLRFNTYRTYNTHIFLCFMFMPSMIK